MTLPRADGRPASSTSQTAGNPTVPMARDTAPGRGPGDNPNTEKGGKTIYGASVGILMLETRFPRIPGDMCNALTWPFPVMFKIVRGATPDRVVRHRAEGLKADFIAAAQELVRDGADGITTNCGFLSLFQDELKAAIPVPVASSSLMQLPMIDMLLAPGKRAGVLTVSAQTLTKEHLICAGARADTPIEGTEGGQEFTRVLLGDELELDVNLATQDILQAGERLTASHPEVGAIVLECTNMIPYARQLRDHLNLPVFSIYSLVTWFQSSLRPRSDFPR